MLNSRIAFAVLLGTLAFGFADAQQLFQPPGANITYGDVTHGIWAQSASTNPAASAAYLSGAGDNARSGTALSGSVGLEYGNIQEIWDFYDEISRAFAKSDPGDDIGGPGQNPGLKPGTGIDLGDIWDLLNPEIDEKVDIIAREMTRQAAILALISAEGYGKAWVAADAPFVFKNERWGGAWTMQLHWSGTSRAFGLVQPLEFTREAAETAIRDWFDTELADRPSTLQLGDQLRLFIDELGNATYVIQNDSLLAAKSARLGSLSAGYSRALLSNEQGTLYAGVKGHLYNTQLSRYGVRFGDITDSELLFDEIRNADFETDTRVGFDAGLLWVAERYQVGAQVRSINEPEFNFPALELPIIDVDLLEALQRDGTYTMDRQLKLEASVFTPDRRWSLHVAGDANSATDPLGDEFQWVTASAGYDTDSTWIPGVRLGYRQNLAGTERSYVSLGATLFRFLNLDVSSALDTTSIDGTDLPESLMVSIGFQITW